ncbi:MAG: type II CAAX endopeptidase family protein [Candidatus Omnitrophota bacterium]
MKISKKAWIIFSVTAILASFLWYKLEYSRFSYINLSIDKKTALHQAETYLKAKGVHPDAYKTAIVFDEDKWCNRYLQKTIGNRTEEKFLQKHDYDLFFWKVRFFRELEKEEYYFKISPRTGQVISFKHLVADTAFAPAIEKEKAKEAARIFLEKNFGINLSLYNFHEEKATRYEKRTEFSFSWEKNGVYVPWGIDGGGATLLTGAVVSGDEVREFYKNRLEVPEKFERYIENQYIVSEYLYNFYSLLFIVFLMISIAILIKRRYDVIPRTVKRCFYSLATLLAVFTIAEFFNAIQEFTMNYTTSTHLASFFGLYFTKNILSVAFLVVGFIIPALAGESLFSEVFPLRRHGSFLHYIKSSFFNRNVSRAIMLGYVIAVITLGLQAVIFYVGQKYIGVWRDWTQLTQFSSAYIPLLSAFTLSVCASFNEEITFRLFGISVITKYVRSTLLAVIATSLLWGLGHTGYAIFPVWFRIIEITCIGIFFGFIFLRYGIIPLIVGHFLFDILWGSAAYIFGRSQPQLYFGSLTLLCLPLVFAIVAYMVNKSDEEKDIQTKLSKTQQYNLEVLITYMSVKKAQGMSIPALKQELIGHNWDHTLITLALDKVFKVH